jgi:hypothetical protein
MLTCYHYADPTCQLSRYSDGLDDPGSIPSSVFVTAVSRPILCLTQCPMQLVLRTLSPG